VAEEPPAPSYWTTTSAQPGGWEPPETHRFAGVAWRGVAFLIDLIVLGAYWWVLLFTPLSTSLGGPPLAALLVVGPMLYFLVGWARFGTTLGMRVLGLRVVRARDGGPIGYSTAAVRLVALAVLIAACIVLVGFGLIALPIVLDPRRRGIHDRVAETLVLRPAFRR
jgi:uncharacterized RDD family membrane protein YckC